MKALSLSFQIPSRIIMLDLSKRIHQIKLHNKLSSVLEKEIPHLTEATMAFVMMYPLAQLLSLQGSLHKHV